VANVIYICCRSDRAITYRRLEDHMGHMGFLDEPAVFEPPLDSVDPDDPQWDSFTCTYRAGKRPIVVRHWIAPEEIQPTMNELLERMEGQSANRERVAAHLADTRQAFVFEMGYDLPQDVWEMLDVTEIFLARECDGLIVADEGVYDANLKTILSFSR
jgi:hypothetical protein